MAQLNSDAEVLTGIPDPEAEHDELVEEARNVLDKNTDLDDLQKHPGFSIWQSFLEGEIDNLYQRLKREQNINQIFKLQAMIEAFELLPKMLNTALIDVENARLTLVQHLEENRTGHSWTR